LRLLRFRRHPVSEEDLSAYLDGRLSDSDKDRVDSHIGSCDACARKLVEMSALLADLRRLPDVKAPRSFTLTPQMAAELRREKDIQQRTSARRVYLGLSGATAAAAVILVALVGSTALLSHNNATTPSSPIVTSRQTLSDNQKNETPPLAEPNLQSGEGGAEATPPPGVGGPAVPGPQQNMPEATPSNEGMLQQDQSGSGASAVPGSTGSVQPGSGDGEGGSESFAPPATPMEKQVAIAEQPQNSNGRPWLWPAYGMLGVLTVVLGTSAFLMRHRWRRLNRNQ
jgi:hypothetical protein